MKDEDVDFILDAVKMVAEHGWKLLPHYMFNPETGEWRHRNHQVDALTHFTLMLLVAT